MRNLLSGCAVLPMDIVQAARDAQNGVKPMPGYAASELSEVRELLEYYKRVAAGSLRIDLGR